MDEKQVRKLRQQLAAQHADMHNAFGPVDNFRHKMGVLDEWCAKLGRNPRDIERTVAISPQDLKDVNAYEDAGADHIIVMLGNPYDLSAVEKVLASR